MMLFQQVTSSLLLFLSIGLVPQDEIPSATLFVRVQNQSSSEMRQRLQELVDQANVTAAEIEEEHRTLMQENDAPVVSSDGANVHELKMRSLRQEIDQLNAILSETTMNTVRAKDALERGGPAVDETVWILTQSGALKGDDQPSSDNAVELKKRILELKVHEADLLGQFGANHPAIISVRNQIDLFEKQIQNAEEDAGREKEDQPSTPTEILKGFVEESEAKKESLQKQLEGKSEEFRLHATQVEKITRGKGEIEAVRERLLQNQEMIELTILKQGELVGEQSSSFDLATHVHSSDFIQSFARKYQTVFEFDDLESLVADLKKRIVVKPDWLGQSDVYSVSFQHDSNLFSKGVTNLLVQELEQSLKLNRESNLVEIAQTVQELEESLSETEKEIQVVAPSSESNREGSLRKLQRKRDLIQMRIEHARKVFAKKRPVMENLSFEFHVLQSSMGLESIDEAKKYNELRREKPLLPELD